MLVVDGAAREAGRLDERLEAALRVLSRNDVRKERKALGMLAELSLGDG